MSGELVQISLPALRQSYEVPLSCHVFYGESIIKGNRKPGGMEARRGTEIHRVHGRYQAQCKERKLSMDLALFDELAAGAGSEAARILRGIRDNYQVDWEHLLATELTMSLDEYFRPTDLRVDFDGIKAHKNSPAHYTGTLDGVYLYRDERRIVIRDWKSHSKPFLPNDTLQAVLYSLFAFQHFPWCDEVVFELHFVRYSKCVRPVTYKRADLPTLIAEVKAKRELQRSVHAGFNAGTLEPCGGPWCWYCPLLANKSCPNISFNENATHTPEEWLQFLNWLGPAASLARKVLQAHLQATGHDVVIRDGNGNPCVYGSIPGVSKVYPVFLRDPSGKGIAINEQDQPVLPIIEKLSNYAHQEPGDTEWMLKLRISSTQMNTPLKAKKRVNLDQDLKDDVFVVSNPKVKVTWPDTYDVDEEQFGEEEEEESED